MGELRVRRERELTAADVAFCERSVPDALEDVASRHPNAVALSGEAPVTYAGLAAAVRRTAESVVERIGPGPEPVGVMFRDIRSWIESTLGVMRTGRIALLLDPKSSPEFLETCVQDSGARLILTDEQTPRPQGVPAETLAGRAASGTRCTPGADSPSVLIYTSGSTGGAKGVLRRHATELYAALTTAEHFRLEPGARMGLILSPASPWGHQMILATLLSGATLFCYRPDDHNLADPEWIAAHEITALALVPSALRVVLGGAGPRPLRSLEVLCLGAEPIAPSDGAQAQMLLSPGARLFYSYGSTEAADVCNCFLDEPGVEARSSVPVGRSVPGKTVRIVDVEDGIGEVVVTSRYLAEGYWRDETETARAFSTEPGGERSYRTGDLGSVDEFGRLILRGRRDRMVKISGRRVELDAVEHALLGHDQVDEAIVLVHERPTGSRMLVGYVTPRWTPLDTQAVKRHVEQMLPAYMVPARLVTVDSLPRLTSGKLDRHRLAEESVTAPVAVASSVEQRLIEIWQRLLELPITVEDDFFASGGDSLLAMEMLVEVDEIFSCSLTPGALLAAPTVRRLAEEIDRSATARAQEPEGQTINARGEGPLLFLAYPLGGSGLRYRWLAEALGDAFPLHLLEAPWWNGASAELRTVEQLAAHHIPQIRRLQPTGPYLLGGTSFGGLVAYEMARQLSAVGEEIALLTVFDTYVGLRAAEVPDPSDPRNWPMEPPGSRRRSLLRRLWLIYATQRHRTWKWLRPARRLRWRLDQRRYGAVPERRRAEYVHDRAIAANDSYRPQPYGGRVNLFRCTADTWPRPDRGWAAVTRGELQISDLAARHGEHLFPPMVQELAAKLAPLITEATSRRSLRQADRQDRSDRAELDLVDG